MIRISRRTEGVPPEDPGELRGYVRSLQDENDERLAEIAERVSDKYDELSFVSKGDGEEVRVPNPFDFVPNRFVVCDVVGAYTVGWSKKARADQDWIYLTSNAPEGTRICVRFERIEQG